MISQQLEISLNLAVNEAARRKHEFVTVEHILYALLYDHDTSDLIRSCGGNIKLIREDLEAYFTEKLQTNVLKEGHLPQPTLGFQRVVQRAAQQVHSSGREAISCAHVVVAIFDEHESFAAYFLKKQEISRLDILQYISHGIEKNGDSKLLSSLANRQVQRDNEENDGEETEERPPSSSPESEKGTRSKDPLALYAVNLCQKARAGGIDPLIGREPELDRTMQILCRRRKNNPLFVGEAGVGKTALAEGLAVKIVNGQVPFALQNAKIYALDMGALLAGTKFRGDFEQRLKKVIAALQDVDGSILFIDEIHTVIGAGSVSGGTMDASNILKPLLASGEIRCMGSTTYKEFRNIFENDHALARRFQKIDVEEPSIEDTYSILKGLKNNYENYHNVHYSNNALRAAAELSAKYINDRKLPDKAIDVIDEAGASVAMNRKDSGRKDVSIDLIQSTVGRMARLPINKVSLKDKESLRNLGEKIKAKVFGQDPAIDALATSVKLARSGLTESDKPIGSFLFTGPTGVGKTEVARQLAEVMGIELIRFDMSEYMERHSVARLIGSPPGYVGFDQGGLLTEAVTKKPHAVLLLDEIEKAHADLHNIMLQVMDYGTLTDNNGRKADFRNIIIIMTTNAGAEELTRKTIGFMRTPDALKGTSEAIRKYFSPEFRNRLSAVVPFAPLDLAIVKMVVKKFIEETNALLAKKKARIELTEEAYEWLSERGYDPLYGARPIKRLVEDKIKQPLADELLFGKLAGGGVVKVSVVEDKFAFEFAA
jgi:ATP-dependent Clp protease ATP-binding subunit ClpA